MDASTQHHFAEVAGVRLHWVEVGDSNDNNVPLVLLHGLSNSHLTWKDVAHVLASGRRVLMPDLPGHGESERPDACYSLAWYAHVMKEWLSALDLQQVDVVGHSFGGGVAQVLLLECPERIRRLILVASGGLGTKVGWVLRFAALPGVVEQFGQPFMDLGTRLVMRNAQLGNGKADIVAELRDFNTRPGSARAFARTVRDVIDWRGQRRTFYQRAHLLKDLPPILVLWGDKDTVIPVEHGREFATLVRGARFKLFEGCGHYLHHEKPESFMTAVREFVEAESLPMPRLACGELKPAGRLAGAWRHMLSYVRAPHLKLFEST